MFAGPADIRGDERVVLSPNFAGISFLAAKGALLSVEVASGCIVAAQALLCFCLAVLASTSSYGWLVALCATGVCLILAFQLGRLAILVLSIYMGKLHKRVYRKSMIYWSWWPVAAPILSLLAVLLGVEFGRVLWYHNFRPYHEIAGMQTYERVEPATTSGTQMQDAGIVSFAPYVAIDRSMATCLMVTDGRTFCLAPISSSGNSTGEPHDFFAVGVDCCTCPGQDFQCGEWDNPYAVGGLRSTDPDLDEHYNITLESWKAAHNITAAHPLFFEWVYDAPNTWRYLWQEAVNTIIVYILAAGLVLAAITLVLAKVLQRLRRSDTAVPTGNPLPPPGFASAWRLLFPDLLQCALEERKQQASMPATAHQASYGSMPPMVVQAPPESQVPAAATSCRLGCSGAPPPCPSVATFSALPLGDQGGPAREAET